MKATEQSRSKTTAAKTAQTAKKKAASARRRPSSKSKFEAQPFATGYSEQGQRLMQRGKSAFLEASKWASEKAGNLPRTARNLNLPDQKAIQSLVQDRPLVLGAVGLGVGIMLGSMLPAMGSSSSSRRRR